MKTTNTQLATKKLKSTIRIPTAQYAYFEVEYEGTEDEIIETHNRLLKKYNGGFGLDEPLFQKCLDEYLTKNTLKNGTELYAQMSVDQQQLFQELKKAFKRITHKLK